MRTNLNITTIFAFAIAIVILILNVLVSQFNTNQLIESKDKVARTWQVQRRLQTILVSLVDAQTGSRGYLLTGNEEFLNRYKDSLTKLPAELSDLRTITARDAEQFDNLKKFTLSVQEMLAFLDQINSDRQKGGKESFDNAVIMQSKSKMDEVRAEIETMNEVATRYLYQREKTARQNEITTRTTISIATFGAILSICLAALLFQRLIQERGKSDKALKQREERFGLAMQAIRGMVFEWNPGNNQTYRSEGLVSLTGYQPSEIDQSEEWWWDQIHPDDKGSIQEIKEKIASNDLNYESEYRFKHRDGNYRNLWAHAILQRGVDGKINRVVGSVVDITSLKQAQASIVSLNARLQRAMAESHHRIKNNLQILAALVEVQNAKNSDKTSHAALERLGQHIRSLGSLHEILTREAKIGSRFDMVSLKGALEEIIPHLQRTADERKIVTEIEEICLPIKQSGSLTLLVNELVSNSLKHGKGSIGLQLKNEGSDGILIVTDEGEGFGEDFNSKTSSKIGLELIQSLVKWDLHGEIVFGNRPEGGAITTVTFPIPDEPPNEFIEEPPLTVKSPLKTS